MRKLFIILSVICIIILGIFLYKNYLSNYLDNKKYTQITFEELNKPLPDLIGVVEFEKLPHLNYLEDLPLLEDCSSNKFFKQDKKDGTEVAINTLKVNNTRARILKSFSLKDGNVIGRIRKTSNGPYSFSGPVDHFCNSGFDVAVFWHKPPFLEGPEYSSVNILSAFNFKPDDLKNLSYYLMGKPDQSLKEKYESETTKYSVCSQIPKAPCFDEPPKPFIFEDGEIVNEENGLVTLHRYRLTDFAPHSIIHIIYTLYPGGLLDKKEETLYSFYNFGVMF